jgi:hypothetical protein
MLPGISSEDCLFADLGVDPAVGGCQSHEATDFMLNAINIEPSSQLVLWQIGTLGDWTYKTQSYDIRSMPLLVKKLARVYPLTHIVTVYEAPMFPGVEPLIAHSSAGFGDGGDVFSECSVRRPAIPASTDPGNNGAVRQQ